MFVQENLQNKHKQVVTAGRSEQQDWNSVTIIINDWYSVSCRSRISTLQTAFRAKNTTGKCNDALLQTKRRPKYPRILLVKL